MQTEVLWAQKIKVCTILYVIYSQLSWKDLKVYLLFKIGLGIASLILIVIFYCFLFWSRRLAGFASLLIKSSAWILTSADTLLEISATLKDV